MFDSHIHTTFSTDSKMNIEDALKRAETLDLGLVITEHMDINYPSNDSYKFHQEEYFKQYSKYISSKLLLGIELGMALNCIEANKVLTERYTFDYVIGSVHLVNELDIYGAAYYEGKTKQKAYEEYLRYIYNCIKTHSFVNALGHIDYISRYARYEDKEIYYEDFTDYIDEILRLLVANNIAIELNTRRLGNKSAAISLLKIYKRYYELGGRMVTLGSDAHTVEAIGSNFNVGTDIIAACNLTPVYFRERKPELIKSLLR